MTRFIAAVSAALVLPLAAFGQEASPSTHSCESLARLSIPNAKVLSASLVKAGGFEPQHGAVAAGRDPSLYKNLPAFCRIQIESTPSPDSEIKMEVWLPVRGWTGRFQAQGNGGFAGYIDDAGMATALGEGYATASTDTGHSGTPTDAAWALGHPEKVIDFGYQGIHEMTVAAKAAIRGFYGRNPRWSYFGSCSNGGRQALMEVQRYPADYDGVIAGAPANFWTHLLGAALWDIQALTATAGSYIPTSKLPAIAAAVNASCDVRDGVRDGIISDPRKCSFDPETLLCRRGDSDSCLTAPQVETLRKLYAGAHDSGGRQIFPGFLPGAELGPGGWRLWVTGSTPGKSLLFMFGTGFFGDFVYGKTRWDYRNVKLADAVRAADSRFAAQLNATDPNLAPFETRRGKLVLYHGWNDPAISSLNSINYYNEVARAMGTEKVKSFVRLYLVPGMQHCEGGPGPDSFGAPGAPAQSDAKHDLQVATQEWVEKGIAPGAIIATKYAETPGQGAQMTRPLCPYPQAAKFKGQGDTNDAANFACSGPN